MPQPDHNATTRSRHAESKRTADLLLAGNHSYCGEPSRRASSGDSAPLWTHTTVVVVPPGGAKREPKLSRKQPRPAVSLSLHRDRGRQWPCAPAAKLASWPAAPARRHCRVRDIQRVGGRQSLWAGGCGNSRGTLQLLAAERASQERGPAGRDRDPACTSNRSDHRNAFLAARPRTLHGAERRRGALMIVVDPLRV